MQVGIQMPKKQPSEKVKLAVGMCGLMLQERALERALRTVDI